MTSKIMENLRIFNSRTGRKDPFRRRGGRVGMYVCGITPYSVTHLGHASTYTFFDVLGRFLRHRGYHTTYVQNLTDIDDDILKKAKEEKRNWRELGEKNAQQFLDDFIWLNNIVPDVYPRASDHIREIITLAETLLRKGIAYEKNGSVYFHVSAYARYGEISKLPKGKMLAAANERGNHPDDPNKKDPLDFVLWQARKKGEPSISTSAVPLKAGQKADAAEVVLLGEPSWPSPWGAGRPGWHIECSAMAQKYLGDTIDIHGGGGDLMFPHHESEEAQSRAAHGKPLARWWMHTGMLRYQGEKMSKSLGNLVLVSDLKKRYSANAVRLYLLSHHYRSSFEFFERDMQAARARERLFQNVWRAQSAGGKPFAISQYHSVFYRALRDDLDTPRALQAMEMLARKVIAEKNKRSAADAKAFLNQAFGIMGLRLSFHTSTQ